jgi:hypothetical protein
MQIVGIAVQENKRRSLALVLTGIQEMAFSRNAVL